MKKLRLLFLLMFFVMIGCAQNQAEETEDLSGLPYAEYLSNSNPVVTITVKDMGTIRLQLFPEVAKNTVNNFIRYIQSGSYAGSSFHRVIEDFMIQGGMVSQTNCSIRGEFPSNGVTNDLNHHRGVISMARTSVYNSATSQFFIVHQNSFFLDPNYASFGGVISGFDVLDQIAAVQTTFNDAPINLIVIENITVKLNGYTVGQVNCANE